MLTYIPSVEALERFKSECKLEEPNLLAGKCQLCIDALLFLIPTPVPTDTLTSSLRVFDDGSTSIKTPLLLSGDDYLLDLVRRCPTIKIVFPSSILFNGFVDLTMLESCVSLELIRIPFSRLTGIESLRNRLRSLVWIRGYNDEDAIEEVETSIFTTFLFDNGHTLKHNLKVDEIFWDRFGTWPLLNYLCISQSNMSSINASTMPPSIKTLDLRMNRIYHFSNLANYSLISTITKLCLDYNSLKELPKLNDNTCATLVHLSLRGNMITSVVGLRNFASLDYLDLSENSICDMRQLFSELMHLSKTLQTVYFERNPVACIPKFAFKCKSILYKLIKFDDRPVKRIFRSSRIDPESVPLTTSSDAPVQSLASASHVYGTFLSEPEIEENIPNERPNHEDSLDDRQRKTNAYKERFVVINDDTNDDSNRSQQLTTPQTSRKQIEVTVDLSRESFIKKNYLFGGVSGSYGSSNQLTQMDPEINQSLKSQHLTEELIEAEKNKLLQRRIELGDDWLISEKQDQTEKPISQSVNDDNQQPNTQNNVIEALNSLDDSREKRFPNESIQKQVKSNLDETAEWDDEDTEDENTVFLVEIYLNGAEFTQSLDDQSNAGNYCFIRVRPRDGLLFEKDCTTGKVLNTLDLKILEQYQCLPADVSHSEAVALRLLFDTTITPKRERIYRFVEDGQCFAFMKLYLANNDRYKTQFEAGLTSQAQSFKALSSAPLTSRNGANYSWFYMCLRCGHRTHRIITDCNNCGSDLIIKDEGSTTNNKVQIADEPNLSSTPNQCFKSNVASGYGHPDDSPILPANQPKRSSRNEIENSSTQPNFNYSTQSEVELSIEFEPSIIDENYFKANIDHYLKLYIEIYIYEQIDSKLRSESIESVCHCLAYNFETKRFIPIVIAFTANFLFVFDYKTATDHVKQTSYDDGEKENKIELRFYKALAGPSSSQFIVSHGPGLLKNLAYWLECGVSIGDTRNEKEKKKRKRKKSKSKLERRTLELFLFYDKTLGKAFLQLFLQAHRSCWRSLKLAEKENDSDLVLIKADLTELTHIDDDHHHMAVNGSVKKKVELAFDDTFRMLLETDSLQDLDASPYSPPQNSFNESVELFLIRSFNLIPNINVSTNADEKVGGSKDLFKVEQNLVLCVTKQNLALCQMVAHFDAITAAILNFRANESMARMLQPLKNFQDRVEMRLLIKDLIVNLLPNIYIDIDKQLLVLRFRDEDQNIAGEVRNFLQANQTKPNFGSTVYDFQIQFYNLNTLKQASKMIQTLWEDNFGVTLTLSKYMPFNN